jgi:RNA-binding protein
MLWIVKMDKTKKELKSRSKLLKPSIRIGKGGIDENQLNEIKKQLKKRELIKIKTLKSYRDKNIKDIAKEVAKETNSELIDVVGFVFVLYKKLQC